MRGRMTVLPFGSPGPGAVCPGVAWRDCEPYQCGQLWGHGGDCTWFTPGDYLPPPLVHPLDLPGRRDTMLAPCPFCEASVGAYEAEFTLVSYPADDDGLRDEMRLLFVPCRCEGRVVFPMRR